jgi:hypothetical protein
MKIFILFFLSGTVCLFLFTECHQCKGKTYPSETFSQEDLNINPYSGKETLNFIDSTNDSIIIFLGKQRGTTVMFQYSNDGDGDEVQIYHCYGDNCNSDWNSTIFGSPSEGYFELDLTFSNKFRTGSLDKLITFTIVCPNPSVSYEYETFCFNTDTIYNGPTYPQDKVIGLINSLKLGNMTYNKVYKLRCSSGNYLYYSIKDGLVGFLTKNSTLFFLKR